MVGAARDPLDNAYGAATLASAAPSVASTIALTSASDFLCFFFFLEPATASELPPFSLSLPPVNDMLTAGCTQLVSKLRSKLLQQLSRLTGSGGMAVRLRDNEVVCDHQQHNGDSQPILHVGKTSSQVRAG